MMDPPLIPAEDDEEERARAGLVPWQNLAVFCKILRA